MSHYPDNFSLAAFDARYGAAVALSPREAELITEHQSVIAMVAKLKAHLAGYTRQEFDSEYQIESLDALVTEAEFRIARIRDEV